MRGSEVHSLCGFRKLGSLKVVSQPKHLRFQRIHCRENLTSISQAVVGGNVSIAYLEDPAVRYERFIVGYRGSLSLTSIGQLVDIMKFRKVESVGPRYTLHSQLEV